jgi:hypothetical protein
MMPKLQNQPINSNTAPKDQVEETRRVLREMNDAANRAIDRQTSGGSGGPQHNK